MCKEKYFFLGFPTKSRLNYDFTPYFIYWVITGTKKNALLTERPAVQKKTLNGEKHHTDMTYSVSQIRIEDLCVALVLPG